MTLNHPIIKNKISNWQKELQALTGNTTLLLVAYHIPPVSIDAEKIIDIVCEETGVSINQIRGGQRFRNDVLARQALAFYLRTMAGMSYAKIGELIGGRDHTTILYSLARFKALLEVGDSMICSMVNKINKRLEEYTTNEQDMATTR